MEDHSRKSIDERNDIDLGSFLYAASKGLRKLGSAISFFFINLAEFFLFFLIFLKKRLIWILLAAIIGFAYGSYLSYANGDKYYSSLTARFNSDSRRALYNTVDYLNALVAERRYTDLSSLFSISEKEAGSLVDFYAEPVRDEVVISDLYKQQFFDISKTSKIRTDTFWVRTITYEDFKKNLTKYDIPLQKITVTSTRMDIFPKIQLGLINTITADGVLKKNHEILQVTQSDEEQIILSSIRGLDTLRTVYNERLRQNQENGAQRNTLAVVSQTQPSTTPELELYDKLLELKDELKSSRNNKASNQEIVQVLASLNSVGHRVGILRQNSVKYSLQAIAVCLALLVIIEMYKALSFYEKRKSQSSQQNKEVTDVDL